MDCVKKLSKYSLIFGFLYSVQAGLAIFLAFATKNVINTAVYGGNFKAWAIVFILICAGIPVLSWVIRYTNQRVTDRHVAKLRFKFLNAVMTRDFEEIRKYHSGVLISRTGADIRAIIEKKTKVDPSIIGELVQLIGAVIVLFYMNQVIALIAVLAGALITASGYAFRKILAGKQRAIKHANENVISMATEIVENPEVTRTVTSSGELNKQFKSKLDEWLSSKKTLTLFSTAGSSVFSWAIQIATCVLIVWGAFQIGKGNLLYGDLVAMMQIVSLFRSPISGLTGIQAQLAAYDASVERVNEIFNLKGMGANADSDSRGNSGAEDSQRDSDTDSQRRSEEDSQRTSGTGSPIHIDKITFRYTDEKEHVFSDYSLDIKTDEWTALTGLSGQGKTTLFRIILGLVKPEAGKVILPKGLKIAYVPQEPVLFSGTIRENMLLAKPDAGDESIWRALDSCQCNFIPRDGGLDMRLSQFGNGLSVGQKQRIAVARTILMAQDEDAFLLLDEPTSSVDVETSESLLSALKSSFKGALVATHAADQKEIFDSEINID